MSAASVARVALCAMLFGLEKVFSQSVTTDAGLNIKYARRGVQNCTSAQFFDTATLQCSSCPVGYYAASSRVACVSCDATSGTYYNFSSSGISALQTWSPAAFTSSSNTTCACKGTGVNLVMAEVYNYGVLEDRCVVCPNGTTATGTGEAATCVATASNTTGALSPLQQLTQVVALLNANQAAFINTLTVTTASFAVRSSDGSGTVGGLTTNSLPLVSLLGPAALACYNGGDRAACNAVANLCVLQLYSDTAGACAIYKALVTYKTAGSGTFNPSAGTTVRAATGPLPWLFYSGTAYQSDGGVDVSVRFKGGSLASGSVSTLSFVLSAFSMDGTWLGFRNFTSQLQLCGAQTTQASSWTNFGWNYQNKCSLTVEGIQAALLDTAQPVFYDLFLQDGADSLYPVPLKVTNRDTAISSANNAGAVRRFFYLDGTLGIDTTSATGEPQYIQYMSSFQMYITLNKSPRDTILPPAVYLSYSALSPDVNAQQPQPVSFGVTYRNDAELKTTFWKGWQTMLIVFEVAVGFPFLCYRVWQYTRNHAVSGEDQGLLIFVALSVIDIGSFMLAFVLLFVTIYYLIIYKLQEASYFLMMPNDDLKNFETTVILAIVGQSVGLLWSMWEQVNIDTFFLDWEKPRKVLTNNGSGEGPAPISCWRMLLVANEWSELQVQRVTSPGFTLLLMNFILVGYNVYSASEVTPLNGDFGMYANTVKSNILRFGIEQAFFLVLFLGQMAFMHLIYYRFISNPVTQLIDLLFLANISLIILDDKHSGYYVHGQNRAAHSDVGMAKLNEELLKEANGTVAARGLVTDYQGDDGKTLADNQTFLLYISDEMRNMYIKKRMDDVLQARQVSRSVKGVNSFLRGGSGTQEALLRGRDDVTEMFRGMVDDVVRNHGTQVVNPTFYEAALRMRPLSSPGTTVMVHDQLNGFTSVTMLGAEFRLYMYEALFLCAIDMGIQNFGISAMVTYIMIRVVKYLREYFGEANLSRKTLIDSHFLI